MLRTISRRVARSSAQCLNEKNRTVDTNRLYGKYSQPGGKKTGDPGCTMRASAQASSMLKDFAGSQGSWRGTGQVSPPLFVDVETLRKKSAEATWNRLSLTVPVLLSFQGRGIGHFVRAPGSGNFNTAAICMVNSRRVLLCTGFNVDENMAETDGPLGTAILGYACFRAGKYVAIVADERNAHLVREQLLILDPACTRTISVEQVKATKKYNTAQWAAIIDKHEPDTVVHTEVPGRNRHGEYINMRGVQIGGFNAALDEIGLIANSRGIDTIGVLDGGNECGSGLIIGVPKALNDGDMQSVVSAAHQVIAWNSNLGAIALAEFIMAAAGKGASCGADDYERMLRKMLKEGAVDGVTRGRNLDERVEDSTRPGHFNYSCVDGFRSAIHVGNLLQIQDLAHNMPLSWK